MNPKNPEVDRYINDLKHWQSEFVALRAIVLDCDLTEEYKWEQPTYTLKGKNIVVIHGFKDYCALLFFKGALMKDDHNLLIQQTENVQSGRQLRFTTLDQILESESVIKDYVADAIAIEKAGLKVVLKDTSDYPFPEELIIKLEEIPGLQDAFDALTPGRQRGYLLFFSAPKQSKTRVDRIEKSIDNIMNGIGLNDDRGR